MNTRLLPPALRAAGVLCEEARRRARLFAVVVCLFLAIPLPASGTPPTLTSSRPGQATASVSVSHWSAAAPTFADGWSWGKFFAMLKGRSRMLQVGAVGMCLALYIIWWRR